MKRYRVYATLDGVRDIGVFDDSETLKEDILERKLAYEGIPQEILKMLNLGVGQLTFVCEKDKTPVSLKECEEIDCEECIYYEDDFTTCKQRLVFEGDN